MDEARSQDVSWWRPRNRRSPPLNRAVSRVLAILLVAALGAGVWWFLRPERGETPIEDDRPPTPTPIVPPNAVPATPHPVETTEIVAAEAVARPDEKLPPVPPFAVPPIVPIAFALYQTSDGTLLGSDLLAAMVAVRRAPIRFDSSETRERFVKTRFRLAAPRSIGGSESAILLFELQGAISLGDGFSCRLDDRALWIGKAGAY
jgi:hypothetical protein